MEHADFIITHVDANTDNYRISVDVSPGGTKEVEVQRSTEFN